jgi:hypothetical protein
LVRQWQEAGSLYAVDAVGDLELEVKKWKRLSSATVLDFWTIPESGDAERIGKDVLLSSRDWTRTDLTTDHPDVDVVLPEPKKLPTPEPSTPANMYTFYVPQHNKKFTIQFSDSSTVEKAKEEVAGKLGVPGEKVNLLLDGMVLRNRLKLSELNIGTRGVTVSISWGFS